ncbi:MAG: GxxExxY protein [Candidatus Omnitrophica bacterium]|nr:GxxExxY protein [Candidatus Omnitrophota bacterium]MBU4457947.1 GxxExxY protein [Candidatus Omnitrophota bacterium]
MKRVDDFLYEKESYKIRGACFEVWKRFGSAYKESIYHKALAKEFKERRLPFKDEKLIDVIYKGEKVGVYRPDFIIADAIIVEIKATPFLGKEDEKRFWHYIRGSEFKLGFLINFGGKKLEIRRRIYEKARTKYQRISA